MTDKSAEKRVTNPLTGGQKGSKPSQLFCAPPEAMLELGKVYGYGAAKYTPHNFRKGYAWSLSYDALYRHFLASIGGEDRDPESGLLHMAHVAWHALTLTQFLLDKEAGRASPFLDDRFVVYYPVRDTFADGIDSELWGEEKAGCFTTKGAAELWDKDEARRFIGAEDVDADEFIDESSPDFHCGCLGSFGACVGGCCPCSEGNHLLQDRGKTS